MIVKALNKRCLQENAKFCLMILFLVQFCGCKVDEI